MNCFEHPDQSAVAQCGNCSKGLCVECATKYQPLSCRSCAEQSLRQSLLEAEATVKTLTKSQIKIGFMLAWAGFFIISGIISSIGEELWWVTWAVSWGIGGLPFIAQPRADLNTPSGQVKALRSDLLFYHTGLAGVIGWIIGIFLFSIILTPLFVVRAIRNFFIIAKDRRELKELLLQAADQAADQTA